MAFGITDYAIFGLTLLISATIGVYYKVSGGKQKTTEEYLLGSKDQKVIPIAFSLVASFASSISMLGTSSESYKYGTHFFVINVAYIVSTLIAIVVYLPVFFKLGHISVYQYLEKRFGMVTRILASLAFSIEMILYMGIVHYAPALAMEAVTGISQIMSIFAIGFICIFYSTIGGIKAVIITDLFQCAMMFCAVFAVIITGVMEAGSFANLWNEAKNSGRIQFSNFSLDPTERITWWTIMIGGTLTHLSLYGVNQTQVQRYVSMKNYKSAAKALLLSCPILIIFQSSLCLAGLAIYFKYRLCDPVKSRNVSADQLLPLYVLEVFSAVPGLTGLFAAGIFSASLSTVSAAVNSLAAVAVEDYINPFYVHYKGTEMSDQRKSYLSKMMALVYGFVCLTVALCARSYKSVLESSLIIFGVVGGPLLAIFTLGMTSTCVDELGAVSGFISGLIIAFIIGFGEPKPPPNYLPTRIDGCGQFNLSVLTVVNDTVHSQARYMDEYPYLFRISYLYYGVIGFLTAILVALLTNTVLKSSKSKTLNPDLFVSFVSKKLKKRYELESTSLRRINTTSSAVE